VNRAGRRALRRAHKGEHQGCGCLLRFLTPVEREHVCPSCGQVSTAPESVVMPTSAELGSLKTVYVSCRRCRAEVEFLFLVEAL